MDSLPETAARQYSPLALAFLGDSVYELMVRSAVMLEGNTSAQKLHDKKVQFVCAAFQSGAVALLMETFTPAEQAVYQRGRNAGGTPSKHADPADYRAATGLESVFGYLHLTGDRERLETLFSAIWRQRDGILQNMK